MLISPPVPLSPRLHFQDSKWEMALRYIAATAVTLLAIAGAQLQISNSFIWILMALTLIGTPFSLWLRLRDLRVGGVVIPRVALNSLTVLASFGSAFTFVLLPMRDFFVPLLTGNVPSTFWLNFGASEPIKALMELFLLFAAFRSFAIISDKDATLTTVPSFSVLLLLIPIHRGIEVVAYFVAWTFVAATLLALDHRSEVRAGVSATVPAIVAGQDVRLGARSLATILGISLLSAVAISAYLASRNPEERSATETAVTSLATRLTNLALALPEVSANSGPERQIDFSSGPTLPSRAQLWQVEAITYGRRPIYPAYWRMFTLSNYNGESWTQSNTELLQVPRVELSEERYPRLRLRGDIGRGDFGRGDFARGGFSFDIGRGERAGEVRDFRIEGYDVERREPDIARQFGKSGVLVRQRITSMVPNIGFLPSQPAVRSVVISDGNQKDIRLRADGAIDVGVVPIGQILSIMSDVPPLAEYGIAGTPIPLKTLSQAKIAASGIVLSRRDRLLNLRLPATLPTRVRDLSAKMLDRAAPNSSNITKARRLAIALQEGAVYTLRPPRIPEGRDATDFFLFEGSRRGYCTYFAGALTVLCRAQGIPARVVSGFAGMPREGPDAGMLREGNAHAWTEVWVDGFGWAVADATPADERGDNAPTWLESWSDWLVTGVNDATLWLTERQIGLVALVALMGVFGIVKRGRGRGRGLAVWLWKSEPDDDFERRAVAQVYRRVARAMTRKFRPKTGWETPDEWLQSCAPNLSKSDGEALRRLTGLYLAALYSARPLPRGSGRLARKTAKGVAWKRVKSG